MQCPHCESSNARQRKDTTDLGYLQYYCRDCQRQYNERAGTLLALLQKFDLSKMIFHQDLAFTLRSYCE